MDLAKFDVSGAASAGADLHLKDPWSGDEIFCEDGSPFVVRVMGNDAPSAKEALRVIKEKQAKGKMSEDEAAQHLVAAHIIGWSDEMGLDGETLPYSPANALKLVQHEKTFWITEQIAPFVMRRRNFAPKTD